MSKRVIAFDNEGAYMVMFNPEIVKKSGPYQAGEGCLSLSGIRRAKRWKPITARQCVAVLPEIAQAKTKFIPRIQSALQQADLSGYPDNMRPLILKDIAAALQKIDGAG